MSKVFKAAGRAVKSVVKAVTKAVTGVVKAVVNVASSVLSFVINPFMGLLGGIPKIPDMNDASTQQAQGVQLQYTGSTEPIPVVYGLRKLGGKVVYVETGSTDNKYMWVAYVFSEGPVEGLYKVFIDDNELDPAVTSSLNAGGSSASDRYVDVTSGKFNGRVRLQFFPGVYFSDPRTSTVPNTSILRDSPSYKTSMAYNGLAVMFARYEWKKINTQAEADANPFTGNIPVLQVTLLGRKVQSLLPNSGTNTAAYGVNERYSTNPAEILYDYLRNPRYGKGLSNSELDFTSFSKAAAKCNQQVEYVPGKYGPILTFNGVIETSMTVFNNVKIILQQMRGYLPYVQGKYKLKIEDAGNENDILSGVATIVATFNQDNIQGDVTYQGISKTSKYNQVAVTYVDPDQGFSNQQVIFPETEAQRQTFITEDGGRENKLEITFPAITNYAIARDFARLLFNKSRFQESCSISVSSQAFELEVGDNIYIQSKILNFNTIPWRIVSISLNESHIFDLGCVRNPDFIYPHTRINEADIVLPTFIPKGAFIFYPSPTLFSVGLNPPTRAVAISAGGGGTVSPITNPAPSDPMGNVIIGGGVGGVNSGNNWVNSGSTNPDGSAGTGVNSPTTPPKVIVIPLPLNETIDITNVVYTVENGLTYATLTTRQPRLAAYSNFLFYYKRAITSETAWTLENINDLPGAGNTINFRIGPLLSGQVYSYRTLVYYGNERSLNFATGQLRAGASGTSESPADTIQVTASAWSVLDTSYVASRQDNYFSSIGCVISVDDVSNGFVADKVSMLWTMTQEINALPINWNVKGFTVYYKLSTDIYWSTDIVQPTNYVPGQPISWRFTYGFPPDSDITTAYDFIFRVLYADGKQPTVQHYFRGIRPLQGTIVDVSGSSAGTTLTVANRLSASFIQPNSSVYTPGIPGGVRITGQLTGSTGDVGTYGLNQSLTRSAGTQFRLISPASYPISPTYGTTGRENVSARTIETPPPGFVGFNANVVVGINSIAHSEGTTPMIRIFYQPPAVADRAQWRGVRLRYRKITPGATTELITFNYTNRTIKFGGNGLAEVGPLERPIELFEQYEYVLTNLYTPDNGQTIVESLFSTYMTGTIYPYRSTDWARTAVGNALLGEWKQSFNIQTNMLTTTAIQTVNSAVATTDVVIQIAGWKIINYPQFYQTNTQIFDNGANYILGAYLELEFSHRHIDNYNSLEVYRRVNKPNTTVRSFAGQNLQYQGVGRWEKVVISRTNNSGNVIVNLRAPLTAEEFGHIFSGTQRFVAGSVPPQAEWAYQVENGLLTYDGVRASGAEQEFLFVVRTTTSGLSTKALLAYVNPNSPVTVYTNEVDLFSGSRPQVVNVSSFNGVYDAGFLRNLNEARTALPAGKLVFAGRPRWTDAATKRITYPQPKRGPSIDT